MYAVIKTGGKQYRVQEKDLISVELLKEEKGKSIIFDTVMLIKNGENCIVGTPYVENAKVEAIIVDNKLEKKVITYKYRKRKDSSTKMGHRQKKTRIQILKITEG